MALRSMAQQAHTTPTIVPVPINVPNTSNKGDKIKAKLPDPLIKEIDKEASKYKKGSRAFRYIEKTPETPRGASVL